MTDVWVFLLLSTNSIAAKMPEGVFKSNVQCLVFVFEDILSCITPF